jgi:calcineurin-like phosphoesterase family protein
LPCFASEFRQNNIDQSPISNFKIIQEKDGVWKIGKMKIKGNKAKLYIGAIEF